MSNFSPYLKQPWAIPDNSNDSIAIGIAVGVATRPTETNVVIGDKAYMTREEAEARGQGGVQVEFCFRTRLSP